jgi:hypothetical protein
VKLIKRSLVLIISIIIVFVFTATLYAAETRINFNYAYGGPDDNSSFGMEYLRNFRDKSKFGVGFFMGGNDSDVSYPEHDYFVPHNDYYYAGTHVSEELGLYLIYDYKLSNSLAIVGKGGLSRIEYTDVNISRATYWSYKGNVEIDYYTMYELGLSYQVNKKYDFGLGYNNRRGVVFDLSFNF